MDTFSGWAKHIHSVVSDTSAFQVELIYLNFGSSVLQCQEIVL